MLLVVKKGHIEEARYLCVKRTKMYSSEDLEKFYFDYQTEWMPRGMSIQAYCSRNNVPYKILDRWIKGIYKRVVPVEVTGIPEGRTQGRPQVRPEQSAGKRPCDRSQERCGGLSLYYSINTCVSIN